MKDNKIKKYFFNNWTILIVLIISIILHFLAIREVGFEYNLNSDDLDYVRSGIEFIKSGTVIMHGVVSAQIMPGMTFLIGLLSAVFGTGIKLWAALKVLYILMNLITIYIVYKTLRLYTNKYISALSCTFFLAIDYIWMDNLILTETPFILLFVLLIYHTLKLSINKTKIDYILIIIYYIMCLFIRPNIGIYPLFLFIYLLFKKYDIKLLFKQCIVAGLIILMCIIPWTYRNYKVFNKFIPLTYGVGNPLLLGTYQGRGYPSDDELDYKTNVDDKAPQEIKVFLENPELEPYLKKYYSLEYDGLKAKYRMKEWWKNSKKSMIFSYLIYKPKLLFYCGFYWYNILGIETSTLMIFRDVEIGLFLCSSIIIILDKTKLKEWIFLMAVYASQIAIYAYTFALNRYGITMFFLRYIIIGLGLDITIKRLNKRRNKHESIIDSTSI